MPSRSRNSFPSDYTDEELRAEARKLERAVTISVNVEIEADHKVLDLGEVEKILSQAKRIILQDCGCRRDKKNCDAPLDVCVTVDQSDDYVTKNAKYHPHECTLEEALNALKRSHEAGLVHMAYVMKGNSRPTVVCSCCVCCCHTLGGLLRRGIATQVLTSNFVAEWDSEKCVKCGRCAERCVFGARTLDNDELKCDQSRCFGCGLCISTCPADAITLVPRR